MLCERRKRKNRAAYVLCYCKIRFLYLHVLLISFLLPDEDSSRFVSNKNNLTLIYFYITVSDYVTHLYITLEQGSLFHNQIKRNSDF